MRKGKGKTLQLRNTFAVTGKILLQFCSYNNNNRKLVLQLLMCYFIVAFTTIKA